MNVVLKYTCWMLLFAGIFLMETGCRARGAEPREHRRIWRKFKTKSKNDFNPYVNKRTQKSTHEISRREKREDDKAIRRAKREYQKGIRRSARKRGGK